MTTDHVTPQGIHYKYKPYRTKTQEILELSCPYDNYAQGSRKRLLFVCSAEMLRSPTGAAVATSLGYNARSCGTGNYALIQLSANLVYWAQKIYFVNQENYWEATNMLFESTEDVLALLKDKAHVLDIPDQYNYMDPELVSIFHNILGAARN